MKCLLALLFFLAPLPCVPQQVYAHTKKPIPQFSIRGVSFADDSKIVRKVFQLNIPGYPEAYNPSIIKFEDGFLLSFRYDNLSLKKASVGLVRLDEHFKVIGKPVIADTTHDLEDVRLFWYNGDIFATGSRIQVKEPSRCVIALSHIDPKTLAFTRVVDLEYHPQIVEKNWVPLVHTNSNGESDLSFVYNHNPLQILQLCSTSSGAIEQSVLPETKKEVEWEKKWGKIRGGTPCLSLGQEQLAFFHSSFFQHARQCWVIGAITFENTFPFQIKRISPSPIIAHGMYTTPFAPRFRKRTFRVAFPGGFVEVQNKTKSLFYLVYGENDSGIKVLVLDKQRVLSSLKDFQ